MPCPARHASPVSAVDEGLATGSYSEYLAKANAPRQRNIARAVAPARVAHRCGKHVFATGSGLGKVSSKKKTRRAIWAAFARLRASVAARTPERVRRRVSPVLNYGEMLLLDHLVVRLAFPNRHKVSDRVWRAAQPLPHQIAAAKRLGIRTVLNLRGQYDIATYAYEREACRRAGLKLVDFRVKSRNAPTRDELLGARDIFQSIDYPVLMHCKSGADRVGLMSVLYRHLHDGVPMTEAIDQLSLRYGHIAQANTGIIDYFFERYIADNARSPIAFYDWVQTVYDPDELRRTFKSSGWANRLVDRVLKRE